MRKPKKLLTLALVGSLASSILVTPLASAAEIEFQATNYLEGANLLEKKAVSIGSDKITYEITKKEGVTTYNLDQNGKKDIVTYNEKTQEFTINGKVTDINSLLGARLSSKNIGTYATTIPSDVERTYPAPSGDIGQLVKYEESSTQIDRAKLSVIAAALSTLFKAPYSTILAILSTILGTSSSATLYYRAQHYVLTDGTARKFILVKYYSDSARKNLVNKTLNWEA